MMKKTVYFISAFILLVVAFTGGFLLGRNTCDLDVAAINTFYATIEEISGSNVLDDEK